MEKKGWKTLAIILLCILILIGGLMVLGFVTQKQVQNKTIQCYYSICADSPEAKFDIAANICSCYNYDVLGKLQVVKQMYLK